MTSILKVTVCIFDSFVIWAFLIIENSVLLQHCDLGILDPCKICDFAKMALVCESHDMGYREIDFNLYKNMSYQSFFPFLQIISQNSLSMMASDKHFEGYSLHI